MVLVIKGNCLKRKSIEIKSDLKLLDKEYENLKEKRGNYHDIKTWNLFLVFFFEYEDIVFCYFLDFLSIF